MIKDQQGGLQEGSKKAERQKSRRREYKKKRFSTEPIRGKAGAVGRLNLPGSSA